uniref:CaM_binding domain-containing protein n=1 Tax=Angiostrongylus cantonensis TaxID=6313 RepID=A0A0K0CZ67_ANGCA
MKDKTDGFTAFKGMVNTVQDVQQRQAVEPANVAQALSDQSYSLMDEEDIAEMSMIAAQIEDAEEFNLTFEAVECSKLNEETEAPYPQEEIEPKLSDKSAKHIDLLCENKDDDVEEVLGLPNESVVSSGLPFHEMYMVLLCVLFIRELQYPTF